MMFGKTDSTARPSVGNACIVKLLFQSLSDIYTKKMTNNEIIARTMEKTPMTEKYRSFYTRYCRTMGRRHIPTMMAIKAYEV